jgi:hypothetical protein
MKTIKAMYLEIPHIIEPWSFNIQISQAHKHDDTVSLSFCIIKHC